MAELADAHRDEEVLAEIRQVIEAARARALRSVNTEMVCAYWEVGRQVHEAIGNRSEYGKHLLEYLSQRLTADYGKGFTVRNLQTMRQVYLAFPNAHTLCAQLSWSHYRILVRIDDKDVRDFYLAEAVRERWTVRQLEGHIKNRYFDRLIASGGANREQLLERARQLYPKTDADDVLKDPYLMDFMGLPDDSRHLEREIEDALASHMPQFLEELGSGFAFVARQYRIDADSRHYYVDFVFYHYGLRCFVLIDLKAGRITPEDVGKMEFYTRLFDEHCKRADDGKTLGIILCAEHDDLVARYTALADERNIYAARFVTELPDEKSLVRALKAACSSIDA